MKKHYTHPAFRLMQLPPVDPIMVSGDPYGNDKVWEEEDV